MPAERGPPRRVGKYELQEPLGRGTCGTVYRAFDPFVGREVALKLAHAGTTAGELASDSGRRTFFSEAWAAGSLTHPNIVPVYDAGIEGADSYIVMEYVPGRTLREHGGEGTERLPVERAVEIVFRCCQALDYAHRRGIVHRDLKPGNIIVSREGTTKVMDFSIALMSARGDDSTPGRAEGTPNYMAPEQIRGVDVGPGADIYALGAVLYELICGRRPFEERDVRALFRVVLEREPPPLAERAPECPEVLARIVHRALAKASADRFESCAEFAAALARLHDRLRRSEHRVAAGAHRDQLRGLAFFDRFSEAETEAVLASGSLLQYRAGEQLIREGELDGSFYLLVLGSAAVTKGGVRIETLGRGDCFGEMGFLAEARRTASISAESDLVALRITRAQLDLAPPETQLLYYRAFTETLIYRLAVTSARLAAAVGGRSGGDS